MLPLALTLPLTRPFDTHTLVGALVIRSASKGSPEVHIAIERRMNHCIRATFNVDAVDDSATFSEGIAAFAFIIASRWRKPIAVVMAASAIGVRAVPQVVFRIAFADTGHASKPRY